MLGLWPDHQGDQGNHDRSRQGHAHERLQQALVAHAGGPHHHPFRTELQARGGGIGAEEQRHRQQILQRHQHFQADHAHDVLGRDLAVGGIAECGRQAHGQVQDHQAADEGGA